MYGSQVSTVCSSYTVLSNISKCNSPCDVYIVYNNTNYSLSKRDVAKGCWAYTLYYIWNKLTYSILKQFPQYKVTKSSQKVSKYIGYNK